MRMPIKHLFSLLIRNYWENIHIYKLTSLSPLRGESNWHEALIHFKDYAYERNISGAAFVYREIAGQVLESLKTRTHWRYDLEDEEKVWDAFKNKCEAKGVKPNDKVDPLKPSDGEKVSLVKFVCDIKNQDNETVAEWAFKMLDGNRIDEAHRKLKKVWGVGDKIASFYLRDIFWLGHNLKPNPGKYIENDYLLQPIDIWVDRGAKALGHKQTSKTSIAKFIRSFEKGNGLPVGGANIGLWVLGSNYLRDLGTFEDILKAIIHKPHNASIKVKIFLSISMAILAKS